MPARVAIRKGAKEFMSSIAAIRDNMPAEPEEVLAAEQEGVKFHFLTNPTKMYRQGWKSHWCRMHQTRIKRLRCQRQTRSSSH